MSAPRVLVVHGPNLNLLGAREPAHYGRHSLPEINRRLVELGDELGAEVLAFQSNHEGDLVERIQEAGGDGPNGGVNGIVINPAAYTHTSVALRDALLAVRLPFVEVHLSNVHRREEFRHRSMLVDIALGVVAGFGPASYELALRGLLGHLKQQGD